MAHPDELARIDAVVSRAQSGDAHLTDDEIEAEVDAFDNALEWRIGSARACQLLASRVAPLCRARPHLAARLMPVLLWAMSQVGLNEAPQIRAALLQFAGEGELDAPVAAWLREAVSDDRALESWIGTVRVWAAQAGGDA